MISANIFYYLRKFKYLKNIWSTSNKMLDFAHVVENNFVILMLNNYFILLLLFEIEIFLTNSWEISLDCILLMDILGAQLRKLAFYW